jgi:hypothetical protein
VSKNDSVLWWPHTFDLKIASFRLRCHRINEYLKSLGKKSSVSTPSLISEVGTLVVSKRYDFETVKFAEIAKREHGVKLIFDLCDNHFYSSKAKNKPLQRDLSSLIALITLADKVVVCSEALSIVVATETSKRIEDVVVIDDLIDNFSHLPPWVKVKRPSDLYRCLVNLLKLRELVRVQPLRSKRLVWFGNLGTAGTSGGLSDLLENIWKLNDAHERFGITLSIVTGPSKDLQLLFSEAKFQVFYFEWGLYDFHRILREHGVAYLPVQLDPFTECKSSNRLVTAMNSGLNVIACEVPSYRKFLPHFSDSESLIDSLEHIYSGVAKPIPPDTLGIICDEDGLMAKWLGLLT